MQQEAGATLPDHIRKKQSNSMFVFGFQRGEQAPRLVPRAERTENDIERIKLIAQMFIKIKF